MPPLSFFFFFDLVQNQVQAKGKQWILIEGILYDVENFDHPGGSKYLCSGIGKDMTTAFNGALYNHSNGARHLLTALRVGVLKNGMELMRDRPDVPCYDTSMEINKKSI